jgi:transposase
VFVTVKGGQKQGEVERVINERSAIREYLRGLPAGSGIALEAGGTYYWLVEEIERAGHQPHLAHPLDCRRRMGTKKKTDVIDATELGKMLRDGTLPEVWIPPAELRDIRELLRLRMFLTHSARTRVKNRIKGVLAQYNLHPEQVQDVFTVSGRAELEGRWNELPAETRASVKQQLKLLDFLETQIEAAEKRLKERMQITPEAQLLDTMPCVGPILSMVMALEIGDVKRFPGAEHLASYAGTVPTVKSSGGRTRLGGISKEVNPTLKWAYIEAANLIVMGQRRLAGSHAVRLYQRISRTKKHAIAIVAVARHLAEASYWILTKREGYREPKVPAKFRQRTGKRVLPLAPEAS